MIARYFPQLDVWNLDEFEFAFWSENALWLDAREHLAMQEKALVAMGSAIGGSAPQQPPRPSGKH